MVQGPVPLTDGEPTVAEPTPTTLTYPGLVGIVVCGVVQPVGTTTLTAEFAGKDTEVSVRKLKVKLLPVLLGVVVPGETFIVPLPLASVNVTDAVNWEDSPVAVARNVAP